MLKISVITLFPDIFEPLLKHLPVKKALDKKLIELNLIDLRDFAIDARGTVDSPAYGGGPGMILRPEPVSGAIESGLSGLNNSSNNRIIFLTPRGVTFNQSMATAYSTSGNLILICGRYEGIDQRVIDYYKEHYRAEELSMGNYVLSGGEIAAMAVVESTVRLIPGAIDNAEALTYESFNPESPQKVEHPQYSRPEIWNGRKVPQVLISGHHKLVQDWKQTN